MTDIAFLIPVCSRNQTYNFLEETPLITKFMKGFENTKDDSFTYKFFIGVDDNDDFYLLNLSELKRNFEVVILTDCNHKPAKAWNKLLEVAYASGSDYFFQIGDDIELLTPNWAKPFISHLKSWNNIGVVGPCEPSSYEIRKSENAILLENAFFHRKHYEIFDTLFHKDIDNWYCDNWITAVYITFGRMKIFSEIHYKNSLRCTIDSNRYIVKEVPLLTEYIDKGVKTLSKIVQQPLKIGLNMIVKNEAHIILEGLNSIFPLIDTYVIVDTGSNDNTKEVIKTFFDSKGISGFIYDSEWKDFGTNRSEALKLCDGKMDYAIVLDADDLINFPRHGKEVLTQILDVEKPNALMILIHLNDLRYYRTQIFKMNDDWKYVGVLHEYATNDKGGVNKIMKLPEFFFMTGRCLGNRSNCDDKMKRDASILLKGLEKEPNNDRYVFYLAQSYRDDGNTEKAIEYYKKRVGMGGWSEEVYFSAYQIARCYVTQKNLIEAEYWAQKATQIRPERAEALYTIARAFRESNDFYKAYHYIEMGRKIEYPKDDVLFVEKFPYEGGFEYEASIVEYYIFSDRKKGLKTSFRYLSKRDEYTHNVISNMKFYIEKVKGVEKDGIEHFNSSELKGSFRGPKFFSLFQGTSSSVEINNEIYCLLRFTESYHLFAVVDKDGNLLRWCLPFYFLKNGLEICSGIRRVGNGYVECYLSSTDKVVLIDLKDLEWIKIEGF